MKSGTAVGVRGVAMGQPPMSDVMTTTGEANLAGGGTEQS